MVDAGIPKRSKKLLELLESLSINPGKVSLLLLIHGHIVHTGAASEFKKLTDCKVAINHRERDWVEKAHQSVPPRVNLW